MNVHRKVNFISIVSTKCAMGKAIVDKVEEGKVGECKHRLGGLCSYTCMRIRMRLIRYFFDNVCLNKNPPSHRGKGWRKLCSEKGRGLLFVGGMTREHRFSIMRISS